MLWRRFFNALLSALYPGRCLVCRKPYRVEMPSGVSGKDFLHARLQNSGYPDVCRKLTQHLLCSRCSEDFHAPFPPYCTCCGQMFDTPEGDNHLCGHCLASPKYFEKARAAGIYNGSLMTLIHRFKYQKKLQLAKPFQGILLAAFIRHFDPQSPVTVIPIPLHRRRLRRRGFNQALMMVRNWTELSVKHGIRHASIAVAPDLLVRTRWTRSQAGLVKTDRMINIRNAFAVPDPDTVKNRRILLVDDVYTTGATVNECARILKQAGACRVEVLTLARTM